VPQSHRFEAPASLLVRANDMPVINGAGYRVKVVLGESNGVRGAVSPSLPMNILDGIIQPGGRFLHGSGTHRGMWVHAVAGSLEVTVDDEHRSLAPGQALAVRAETATEIGLRNASREPVQFALFDGAQINEAYIQDGPFVMDHSSRSPTSKPPTQQAGWAVSTRTKVHGETRSALTASAVSAIVASTNRPKRIGIVLTNTCQRLCRIRNAT